LEIETGHLSTFERPDQLAQSVLDFVSSGSGSPELP
jgi:hypothetical protein